MARNASNEFQRWLYEQVNGQSFEAIRLKGGPSPSRMHAYLKRGAKPTRENADKLAAVFGVPPDDLWRMVQRAFSPPTFDFPSDNLGPVDWDAMTPEDAAIVARVLGGVMRVLEAKARQGADGA